MKQVLIVDDSQAVRRWLIKPVTAAHVVRTVVAVTERLKS